MSPATVCRVEVCGGAQNVRTVLPILTLSRSRNVARWASLRPFRKVPLRDSPSSTIVHRPATRSRTACTRDTWLSWLRQTSAEVARPIVTGPPAAGSDQRCSCPAGLRSARYASSCSGPAPTSCAQATLDMLSSHFRACPLGGPPSMPSAQALTPRVGQYRTLGGFPPALRPKKVESGVEPAV